MSKTGVSVPLSLQTQGVEENFSALRKRLEAEMLALQKRAEAIARVTGQKTILRRDVPFQGRDPITGTRYEGEAPIRAEFDPAREERTFQKEQRDEFARRRRIQRRWNARRRRLEAAQDRRLRQQERDEDWFIRDSAAAVREAKDAKVKRGQRSSQMMMGGAGVLTALTMPISGFTPLTVGFASMSGVGFGIAAGFAVMVRGMIDATSALSRVQDSLAEMAISAKAVSDNFEDMDAKMKGRGVAQGFLVTEQRLSRMKEWDKMIEKSGVSLSVLNESFGQLREDLSSAGRNILTTLMGEGPQAGKGLFKALAGSITPTPLLLPFTRGYAGSLFDRGQEALASRGPAIEQAIKNLEEGQSFKSAFVGPAQLSKRIQQAAASREQKEDKIIEWQIKQLEELQKQTKELTKNRVDKEQELIESGGSPLWFLGF